MKEMQNNCVCVKMCGIIGHIDVGMCGWERCGYVGLMWCVLDNKSFYYHGSHNFALGLRVKLVQVILHTQKHS